MTEQTIGFEANIAPELAQFERPIADAQYHPDNVRQHTIDKIAQSLRVHGQRSPIIVQSSTGYIVKGNGTQEAAALLGWATTAQVWQEMSDEQALAYLYADNRASDKASYDRKKLFAGLNKMQQGPGLFDTLWEIEEFEDLDEELAGSTTLEPTESQAEFATTDGGTIKHDSASKSAAKMKEVPILLSQADHASFVVRLRILQTAFGTAGTIPTILEAMRRQAELEESGQEANGPVQSDAALYTAKREVVTELRDYFVALGADKTYTATQIAARLEAMVPYRQTEIVPVADGQTELFPEGEVGEPLPNMVTPASVDREEFGLDPIVDPLFVAPAAQTFDIPAGEPLVNADQAEALRRYRAKR
jgi:hypothetical protein